jgi:hypothetical protein
MLQRKNFNIDNTLETLEHLFFEWDLDLNITEMMLDCRVRFNLKCHKEVTIIGYWSLWNSRNKIIIEDAIPDQYSCMKFFKDTFQLVMHKAKLSPPLARYFVNLLCISYLLSTHAQNFCTYFL